MRALLNTQMNVFALIVMLLIITRLFRLNTKVFFDQRLFAYLTVSVALMLIFDSCMWLADAKEGVLYRLLNRGSSLLYYIFNPLPTLIWALYVDYKIYSDESRIAKLSIGFLILFLVNAAISALSLWVGLYFKIDEGNVYHRGPLFFLMAAICFAYYVYSLILIAIKRNGIEPANRIPLLAFPLLPMLAGIIQTAFYGVSLIWLSMTLAMLLVFVSIQNREINTDYLTGLYNRRQFDWYCAQLDKKKIKSKYIAGILIDIDGFKQINDRYGHIMGDQAIVYTAEILKDSVRSGVLVARYAGDEFVIMSETNRSDEHKQIAKRIRQNVKLFNDKNCTPYQITLSMGYDIKRDHSSMNSEKFLEHIDSLMYSAKRQKNST